jgi:uncharacterized protein (TIGR00730 family)
MNRPSFNICVFCGSQPGLDPVYNATAGALGVSLAERHIGLVYGGAAIGLMGSVATGGQASGGYVAGVLPMTLLAYDIAHPGLSALTIVPSIHERKVLMYQLADAFIMLPGGVGTLEEFFETVTWAQLGLHTKPIGLLNVSGFFTPLLAYLDHAVQTGFIPIAVRKMVHVCNEVESLLDILYQLNAEE